jgi:hypothetical protein
MSGVSWLKQLRVAGTDATAVERLIAAGVDNDVLQHAGGAVLSCPPTAALAVSAGRLIEQLTGRGWTGDTELAVELEHFRAGTISDLTALSVDLDDLGEALDQSPASESYIDLANGTVWPGEVFDVGQEPDDFDPDDTDRWLLVAGLGSKTAYTVMERFIATVDSPGLVSQLTEATRGSGAFRRFNLVLSRHDDVNGRWHRFRDDARLGQARAWLAEQGYRPAR